MNRITTPKPVVVSLHDDQITPWKIAEAADLVHLAGGETAIIAGRRVNAGAAGRAREEFYDECEIAMVSLSVGETRLAMIAAGRAGKQFANYVHNLGVSDDPRSATLLRVPAELSKSQECKAALLLAFDTQAHIRAAGGKPELAKSAKSMTHVLALSMSEPRLPNAAVQER